MSDDNTADWAQELAESLLTCYCPNSYINRGQHRGICATHLRDDVAAALRSAHSRGVEEERERVLEIVTDGICDHERDEACETNTCGLCGENDLVNEIARRIKEGE